jgi:uncharacterized protein (DUF4415 family)
MSYLSFRREELLGAKGKNTKKALSSKARAKTLARLKAMREEDIDLSDIPEVLDFSKAVVGKFYRPVKASLTIRLDADVLAWLKSQGSGYQTRINNLLRKAMELNVHRSV